MKGNYLNSLRCNSFKMKKKEKIKSKKFNKEWKEDSRLLSNAVKE